MLQCAHKMWAGAHPRGMEFVVCIAVRGSRRRAGRRGARWEQGSSLCGLIVVMLPESRDPVGSPGAEQRKCPLSIPWGTGPEMGLEEGTLRLSPEARPELPTVR